MNCKAALLLFSCSFIFGSLIADSGAASSDVEDAVLSLKAAFGKPIPPEGSGGLHGAQPIQFADPEAAAEAKRAIEILIQANSR
jgi:hypothetical protein